MTNPPPLIIRQVGIALFGEHHWRSQLAAALKVSERSLQRWAAGEPVPIGVLRNLLDLLHARTSAIADLVPTIEKLISKSER